MDWLKAFFGPKGDEILPSIKRVLIVAGFLVAIVFFSVDKNEAGGAFLGFVALAVGITAITKT